MDARTLGGSGANLVRDSVGRWDGDTLIIDTIAFNGKTKIDKSSIGHPRDQLHTIERFRRTDLSHIDYVLTIDDPKTYTKPWDSVRTWTLRPEWEIMEYSCEENNKSLREGRIKPPEYDSKPYSMMAVRWRQP